MVSWWIKIKKVLFTKQITSSLSIKTTFAKIKQENVKRDYRINKIFSRLNTHFIQLQTHTKTIQQLEKEVTEFKKIINEINVISTGAIQHKSIKRLNTPLNRLNGTTNRLNATNRPVEILTNNTQLSLQEKRILMVLFDNNGLALSYNDIAKLLNKSPNTVKTQINQLKVKTNLLHETIDSEGIKRYGLKEKVKLDKFVE